MAENSVSSVLLTKQVEKDVLYGEAALVTAEGGFQSLDVVGHYMPDLGGGYSSYGFILLTTESGGVIAIQRMSPLLGETNDWAGSYELGLPTQPITGGRVVVFPMTPDGSGPVSPYLTGTLRP